MMFYEYNVPFTRWRNDKQRKYVRVYKTAELFPESAVEGHDGL